MTSIRKPRGDRPRKRTIKLRELKHVIACDYQGANAARLVVDEERPVTRGDCLDGERPCPYVSCTYHLFLEVNPRTGAITLNFPHLELWDLADTCALDVADRGEHTLEQLGQLLNLTRERVRQVETRTLVALRAACVALGIDDTLLPFSSRLSGANAPEAAL